MRNAKEKVAIDQLLKEIASAKVMGETGSARMARFLAAGESDCGPIIAAGIIRGETILDAIRANSSPPPKVLDDFVEGRGSAPRRRPWTN